MNEHDVRSEVVKFFEIVAPLSRRRARDVPTPAFTVRPEKQGVWDSNPREKIARWLEGERGTRFRYSDRSPFAVRGAAGGYTPDLNLIWINTTSDDYRQFGTACHETAHALTYHRLLVNPHKGSWARSLQHDENYNVGEMVAETVSFVVTRQILHHTTAHSALYVAHYAGKERDVVGALTTALPLATSAALAMIRAIDD